MRFGSVCSGIEAASVAGKPCTKCGLQKQLGDYHKSAKSGDGRASWCKKCANGIVRQIRKRKYDPTSKRRWQLKTRYGLTPEQIEAMRAAQGGKCALCPTDLAKFHVDHCHNTGEVRGLLCHRCNIRLGGWDDLDWRRRAIQYLGLNGDAPLSEAA